MASYRIPSRRMELPYFLARNSANIFHKKWYPVRCHTEIFTYPPDSTFTGRNTWNSVEGFLEGEFSAGEGESSDGE